jgi:hypothetical protein
MRYIRKLSYVYHHLCIIYSVVRDILFSERAWRPTFFRWHRKWGNSAHRTGLTLVSTHRAWHTSCTNVGAHTVTSTHRACTHCAEDISSPGPVDIGRGNTIVFGWVFGVLLWAEGNPPALNWSQNGRPTNERHHTTTIDILDRLPTSQALTLEPEP